MLGCVPFRFSPADFPDHHLLTVGRQANRACFLSCLAVGEWISAVRPLFVVHVHRAFPVAQRESGHVDDHLAAAWIQRATPDSPEAGSALFVSIIQVAIALGSLVGGVVVDHVGMSADFLLGSGLALLGLPALASSGRSERVVPAEAIACPACTD